MSGLNFWDFLVMLGITNDICDRSLHGFFFQFLLSPMHDSSHILLMDEYNLLEMK